MNGERRLAIIGCPVLEDEIVYLLSSDKGLKDIFVVEDDHSEKLIRKLSQKGVGIVPITEEGISALPESDGRSVVVWMKSWGFTRNPRNWGRRSPDRQR